MVLLRAMFHTRRLTPQNRNANALHALHALRRLSTIASALGHHKELVPDDFPPVATWTRAIGLRELFIFIEDTTEIKWLIN